MKDFDRLKKEVLDKELCTGCGTCIGECPVNTIGISNGKIENVANKCVHCGKCIDACPGAEFKMNDFSNNIYHSKYIINNTLGHYQSIWNAYASECKIRDNGASGGIVTQLLIHLLNTKIIDGAVGLKEKEDSKTEYDVIIASSKGEILSCAKSKYVVFPTNKIIKKIKESSNSQLAFVGLPCQIHGIRKALEFDDLLKNKIAIFIGIFCGFNMTADATKYLISKSGIKKAEIQELYYRYKKDGDTGFYIKSYNGKEFFVSKHGYTFLNLIFSPSRCWKCFDYSNEFCDISVGDAWNKQGGWSRVLIRTDIGRKVFQNAVNDNYICAEKSQESEILKTQNTVLTYKKEQIGIRKKLMKYFPEYGIIYPPRKFKTTVTAIVMLSILEIFKSPFGKLIVKIIPFNFLVRLSKKIKSKEILNEFS